MARAQKGETQAGVRQCLFCDNIASSREHIWPDWLVREFEKYGPNQHVNASFLLNKQQIRAWNQPTITHTAKFVCRPCNEVWMSQLEHYVKPLLLPFVHHATRITGVFNTEQQCGIAAWLTLRSMIFDALAPKHGDRYYTQSERTAFANSPSMRPPRNTHIWLAPFVSEKRYAYFTVVNKVRASEGYGVHVVTIAINQVVAKLVTWKGHGRRINHRTMNRSGWNSIARRIWPVPRRDVLWRPPLHVTDQTFQAFIDRFRPEG
jgi:hypothetical protein